MQNISPIMFLKIWWLKHQLKSGNSIKSRLAEKKLFEDDKYLNSGILEMLIKDPSLEVRMASTRVLNQKGWRPSNILDLKALALNPDPSAAALIRRFNYKNLQEETEALQLLLNINPARSVSILQTICSSYSGDIVQKCADILETVLKQYAAQIDAEDLKMLAEMKEELVVYYIPASGLTLANSTRGTISSQPITSLAKSEIHRRRTFAS